MGCGCGSKQKIIPNIFNNPEANGNPVVWGPVLWKILHIFAEKIGKTQNNSIDTDQARAIETVIYLLPFVIPCSECQKHSREYINANRFTWIGLYGESLQSAVRRWLYTFHNAVRVLTNQSILPSIDDCITLYSSAIIEDCDISLITANIIYGTRIGIVKLDNWKKWILQCNRLRILLG